MVEEREREIKSVETLINIFVELWERQSQTEDDVPPEGFEEAIEQAWIDLDL